MKRKRQNHTAAFKAQVALAALKGDRSVNELAGQFGVHPTLIHAWKKLLLAGAEDVFAQGAKTSAAQAEALQADLFEQIGRLKLALERVKKQAAPCGCTTARPDQARPSHAECAPAVRAARAGAVEPVLPVGGGVARGPGTDAADRRGVHRASVLRQPPPGGGAEHARGAGQP